MGSRFWTRAERRLLPEVGVVGTDKDIQYVNTREYNNTVTRREYLLLRYPSGATATAVLCCLEGREAVACFASFFWRGSIGGVDEKVKAHNRLRRHVAFLGCGGTQRTISTISRQNVSLSFKSLVCCSCLQSHQQSC